MSVMSIMRNYRKPYLQVFIFCKWKFLFPLYYKHFQIYRYAQLRLHIQEHCVCICDIKTDSENTIYNRYVHILHVCLSRSDLPIYDAPGESKNHLLRYFLCFLSMNGKHTSLYNISTRVTFAVGVSSLNRNTGFLYMQVEVCDGWKN